MTVPDSVQSLYETFYADIRELLAATPLDDIAREYIDGWLEQYLSGCKNLAPKYNRADMLNHLRSLNVADRIGFEATSVILLTHAKHQSNDENSSNFQRIMEVLKIFSSQAYVY